jgi:hypothetical protein
MSDFVHGDQADVRHSHDLKHHDDVEAQSAELKGETAPAYDAAPETESDEVIKARELQQKKGFLRSMRRGEEWLDEKMGIETQGIDRIHEEDKRPPSILNVFFLWWSLTCHVGTLPIGVLGPEFGLSLNQSIAAIVVGTILGALCTAYTGTLGPKVSLHSKSRREKMANFFGSLVFVLLPHLVTRSGSTAQSSAQSSMLSLAAVSRLSTSWSLGKSSLPSRTIP